jgi:hypothetical protein
MDYPFSIFFPEDGSDDAPGAIRLTVAAIIACLGTGVVDGVQIAEADVAPYFQDKKIKRASTAFNEEAEWDVWRRSHSYINIKPSGTLAVAVTKVIRALTTSILRNQLPTIDMKVNLDGSIDSDQTWIRMRDFRNWAHVHKLNLDDHYVEYVENENEIFSAAIDSGDSVRQRMENPDIEKVKTDQARSILENLAGEMVEGSDAWKYCESLILENLTLKAKNSESQSAEKPLKTSERKTLLAIIAALCKEAKIDYTKHAKSAGLIQSTAALMGISVGETTIENHLKKIPDALATRMK